MHEILKGSEVLLLNFRRHLYIFHTYVLSFKALFLAWA